MGLGNFFKELLVRGNQRHEARIQKHDRLHEGDVRMPGGQTGATKKGHAAGAWGHHRTIEERPVRRGRIG